MTINTYVIPVILILFLTYIYFLFTGYTKQHFTSDQILYDIKNNLKDPKQDFRFYRVDLKWFQEQSLVVITWINNRNKYDERLDYNEIIIPQYDSPAIYIFSRVQKNFIENLIFPEAIYRKEAQVDLVVDSKRFLDEQKKELVEDLQQPELWIWVTDDDLNARSINEIDLYNPDILKINDSQEWMILTFWDIRYWFSTVPVYYWLLYYDYNAGEYTIKSIVSSDSNTKNIKSLCTHVKFDNPGDKKLCMTEWYEIRLFDTEEVHFMYNWEEVIYKLTVSDSDTTIDLSWGILKFAYNIWLLSWECHACEKLKLRSNFQWSQRDLDFWIIDNDFTIE